MFFYPKSEAKKVYNKMNIHVTSIKARIGAPLFLTIRFYVLGENNITTTIHKKISSVPII